MMPQRHGSNFVGFWNFLLEIFLLQEFKDEENPSQCFMGLLGGGNDAKNFFSFSFGFGSSSAQWSQRGREVWRGFGSSSRVLEWFGLEEPKDHPIPTPSVYKTQLWPKIQGSSPFSYLGIVAFPQRKVTLTSLLDFVQFQAGETAENSEIKIVYWGYEQLIWAETSLWSCPSSSFLFFFLDWKGSA